MSGETEQNVSGWTVDTLLGLLNERDRRYGEHFMAQEEAVRAALLTAKEATTKSETALEKRFDGVNEFRAALNDATKENVSRSEYNAAHANLIDRVAEQGTRLERLETEARTRASTTVETRAENVDTRAGVSLNRDLILMFVTFVAVAAAVVSVVINATT